ncbi:MAG: tetratricopeptide repeat protein, partial [Planctomycetota bacterium]|nr:tetratricopeptide repeat protein [Planctomycetota bacterium]
MNRTNFFSIATGAFLLYAFLLLSAGLSSAESRNSAQATRFYNDGLQLSQAKYWKEAAHEFRKAIQHDPKHKLAFANLGVALSQTGQHKEALLAFEEAMSLGYDHALLRYNRGLSFAKLNLIEEAVKEIKISLKMDFRNVKALYDL